MEALQQLKSWLLIMPIMFIDSIMAAAKPANRNAKAPGPVTKININKNIITVQYIISGYTHVLVNIADACNEAIDVIEDSFEEMEGNYKITYRLVDKYMPGEYQVNLLLNGNNSCTKKFYVTGNKITSI